MAKVLIIDDEKVLSRMVQKLLEANKYEVMAKFLVTNCVVQLSVQHCQNRSPLTMRWLGQGSGPRMRMRLARSAAPVAMRC